ncbi:heme-degrading domain-containing protein [Marinobacterium rhizophilum]|uniref:Heme-degrading domain-containing protein n=1 Tax=Marinobacterium rhizophilum TaxID=420402 RepID=A0ABY5HJS7_9GAMM|nr:heme-degrading domain-containing protein [Marinobacterium rhizophilum]UTW12116.1 heme-degrading domain-containing protein [Marinobacterium rhizophilum]
MNTLNSALEQQEQALVFDGFDEDTACVLGAALRERAAAQNAPVVIDIRSANRRFYFAALPGSAPDNDEWARRKGNMALRKQCSSLLCGERLKASGKDVGPDMGLDPLDYAAHGGSFPVRVRGVGVVAVMTVSGLPSRDDHELIVAVLAAHLGVNNISLDALMGG